MGGISRGFAPLEASVGVLKVRPRHPPIAHGNRFASIGEEERLASRGLEILDADWIHLEVDHFIGDQQEHSVIAISPNPAEHPPRANMAQGGEHRMQAFQEGVRRAHGHDCRRR